MNKTAQLLLRLEDFGRQVPALQEHETEIVSALAILLLQILSVEQGEEGNDDL